MKRFFLGAIIFSLAFAGCGVFMNEAELVKAEYKSENVCRVWLDGTASGSWNFVLTGEGTAVYSVGGTSTSGSLSGTAEYSITLAKGEVFSPGDKVIVTLDTVDAGSVSFTVPVGAEENKPAQNDGNSSGAETSENPTEASGGTEETTPPAFTAAFERTTGSGIFVFSMTEVAPGAGVYECVEVSPVLSEFTSNWASAASKCAALECGEGMGWRLPTIDELKLLYKNFGRTHLEGYFQGTGNAYTRSYTYWSSTTDLPTSSRALCYDFSDRGGPPPDDNYDYNTRATWETRTQTLWVRAVRTCYIDTRPDAQN